MSRLFIIGILCCICAACQSQIDWCAQENQLIRVWKIEQIEYQFDNGNQRQVQSADTVYFEEFLPEGKYKIEYCVSGQTPVQIREGTWEVSENYQTLLFDKGTENEDVASIDTLNCTRLVFTQQGANPYLGGKFSITKRLNISLDCTICP